MEKSREEFIVFIRQAVHDRSSIAYEELYQFLVNSFCRADSTMRGKVTMDSFDVLIEEAAALPRLYGYAPKTIEMFPTEYARREGRSKVFKEMDTENTGYITLDNWMSYALGHIEKKVTTLPKDILGGSNKEVSKEEFLSFMKKAVNKSSPEYRELYFFLVKTFMTGDKERTGLVGPRAFDQMIEDAAEAPRRFGLAPATNDLFPSAMVRYQKRKAYFDKMDLSKTGAISLDEWIKYAYEHIVGKVAGLK